MDRFSAPAGIVWLLMNGTPTPQPSTLKTSANYANSGDEQVASITCSPLRCALGGMRELSSELLVSPPLRSGEYQEFEQMPLRGPAQLAHSAGKRRAAWGRDGTSKGVLGRQHRGAASRPAGNRGQEKAFRTAAAIRPTGRELP